MERKTITVAETADYIGISKEQVYKMIREGEMPGVKVGRRVLIDKHSIDRWFADQEEAQLQERNKKNTPLHGRIK